MEDAPEGVSPAPPNTHAVGGQASAAFALLHPKVQRWIWEQRWTELRDAQEAAVRPILDAQTDVIIAAATAGGKTEAAFLPICSRLVNDAGGGIRALDISPLKALINDQFGRLEHLCNHLDIPVHRWHGDVGAAARRNLLRNPSGILLITPESLEALHVLRGTHLAALFARLEHVVVDELHSFIGSERGCQVQSLLHRIERVLRRRVPRIGLSATLGDMRIAAAYLRPTAPESVHVIESSEQGNGLKLQIRGYREMPPRISEEAGSADPEAREEGNGDRWDIAQHVFATLRGQDNLVFANRKSDVEWYADRLAHLSEQARVPNEFLPHHGSLSKELREITEEALKDRSRPITAVCTTTLEMGIDIGSVASVAQIGAPASVASVRQRLGRSGRRGDPAVLRMYISERGELPADAPLSDSIREELVQSIAMVRLLLTRWCESAPTGALHLSTLVQQTLSLVAQYGAVSAADAWTALCATGPFSGVDQGLFGELLRCLGQRDLLTQTGNGELVLGLTGERVVGHYSFYAAFMTPEEYRLIAQGRMLGTLPVLFPLTAGTCLIFAGRRWKITAVDEERHVIDLVPSPGGKPPLFHGLGQLVDDRVREEMRLVLEGSDQPAYCDATALDLLTEARANYRRLGLHKQCILAQGTGLLVVPWAGDRIVTTLCVALSSVRVPSSKEGLSIRIERTSRGALLAALGDVVADPPDPVVLAGTVLNKRREKYDGLLSERLLATEFASRDLDVPGACSIAKRLLLSEAVGSS